SHTLFERARVLLELAERLLQSLERVTHAALDGVLSDSRHLGDLFEGQVCDLAQQKYLALLLGKRVDGGRDARADLGRNRGALDARAWIAVGDRFAERS